MFQGYIKSQTKWKCALLLFSFVMSASSLAGKSAHHSPHGRRRPMHRRSAAKHIVLTNTKVQALSDPRRLALWQYFQACACPASRWANTFVQEADRHGLDWRLVASISMIESTGGKH